MVANLPSQVWSATNDVSKWALICARVLLQITQDYLNNWGKSFCKKLECVEIATSGSTVTQVVYRQCDNNVYVWTNRLNPFGWVH